MATRAQLENALRNADTAGDAQAAQQFAKAIQAGSFDQEAVQPETQKKATEQPRKQLLKNVGIPLLNDIIEPVATAVSSIVAEPMAGLTGLFSLPFGHEQATKNVEAVKKALTYIPKTAEGMETLRQVADVLEPVGQAVTDVEDFAGDTAFTATGSPIIGAVAKAVPTAALEALGVGSIKRAAKTGRAINREGEPVPDRPLKSETQATYKDIEKSLKQKNIKKAADQVQPDVEILKAAEDLGINLNPSAYSKNQAYRQMEQALKDRPGSKLGEIESRAISDLGESADKLISDIGGTTDKSILDIDIRDNITNKITKLGKDAGRIYDKVGATIPSKTKITPKNTISYLDETLEKLGGDTSLLSAPEKRLLALTGEGRSPTYAALDRVRKDVGAGFKGKGVFKDESASILKRVYKSLSEDQQDVAKAFGVGEEYSLAKKLVSTRKDLEKSAQKLLGRDLQKSIIPKLISAATALTKGDVSKFKDLMNSIPRDKRTEVAGTMLNDLFTQGARNKGALGQGFVNAYKGLKRNKAAKDVLFRDLPKGARARFDKIGKVAEGIYKAKALENKSRTAASIIAAMDDGGLLSKMYSGAKRVPGVRGASTIADAFLNKVTPATQVADDLLTSPSFRKAIDLAADGKSRQAENIIKSSPSFKKWLKSQKDSVRNIARVTGLIPYLTNQDEK